MSEATQNAAPRRIQRRRTKGWRMPPNTVYVGRGTKWGNPYHFGQRVLDAQEFRADLEIALGLRSFSPSHGPTTPRFAWMADDLHELRGKNLACWCPLDEPCHADVLLELANDTAPHHRATQITEDDTEPSAVQSAIHNLK